MKIKYQRLSKSEKKASRMAFYQTEKGMKIRKSIKTARICAILSIIYALALLSESFLKHSFIPNLYYATIAIIFGIISLIFAHRIIIKAVNEYVINNPK